jgi:hypothetical protein
MEFKVGDRVFDVAVFLDKEGNFLEEEGVIVKITPDAYHIKLDNYPKVMGFLPRWIKCVDEKYYGDFQAKILDRIKWNSK